MRSQHNRAIIACAGSGKTTRLVSDSLASPDHRVAILTYTNNNVREIRKRFAERNSSVPAYVDVMTWYTFLLRHCVRPYQNAKYDGHRVESLSFVNTRSARGVPETNTRNYYFASDGSIYSDKVSRFAVECQSESRGLVVSRLSDIYTDLFIDEFQDLAGWDLEVVKLLLESNIRIKLVGDPRQHVYSTNPSSKHEQYRGSGVVRLLDKWQDDGICSMESMSNTYRCNSAICSFSNQLWPAMAEMKSCQRKATDHDGVFLVSTDSVSDYMGRFNPQVLRYNKNSNTLGYAAMNFGQAKGLEFDRVLIFPTSPIRKFLQSGDPSEAEKTKGKLHVAVTRARFSVAFVLDVDSDVVRNRWTK